eukprot:CAMPEP_0113533422 /NCGR_PEP_ID=MMETSP0015_2-20120614/4598_1 /TAXON_ID=2838 /ORGANISM="Odontella" /LENGTH=432 /DNA_ID=CAMNT_0000432477 /DNA_START=215 /DNA_END=1513 /DNA_ORIENTATION=- /assembly_acc=CAM_ASM_000160
MAPQPRPLPPSTNGRLVVKVLSVYDLPDDTQPSCVSLVALGSEVRTGPPAARHKDRNSFKFAIPGKSPVDISSLQTSGSNELVISAPLPALYPHTVTLRVTFPKKDGGAANLIANYKLDSLRINETKWLVLNLSPESAGGGREEEKKDPESNGDANEHPPTLRMQMRLEGPFRPEISTVVGMSKTWFGTVDGVSDAAGSTVRSLTTDLPGKVPALRILLIPTVPLAGLGVALLPVGAGILIIGLPFFLPLLVVLITFAASVGAIFGSLYVSTRDGRAKIAPFVTPVYSTFASTPAGQSFLYETGPRPSPVTLARCVLPDSMTGKLIASLLIDLIGSSSYLLPLVGEAFDLSWAPTQAVLVAAMYDDVSPSLKYVAFAEEILPFTDLIPSATYGWLREFGPGFFDEGKKKVNDLTVAVRGEREALRRGGSPTS